MKKTIVSMMMAGALLMGGSAFAQTTDGNTGATTQKECVKKDGKSCSNCPDAKATKGDKKGKKNHGPKFNPFDGVQLTADQQQRLQVLQQGLGPVKLDKEQMENIPVNPNLTPEQKKQLKAEKKAKKLETKKKYLSGVKEILTPDQYVIFLENVYLYSPQNQGKGGKEANKSKGHKGDKGKGHKGEKPGAPKTK